MRTIRRVIVSALIFSKDNKVLMCKDNPERGGVYMDCWKIPGGGINEGETKLQTLIREVKEEVGINISKVKIDPINYKYGGESEKTLKDTGERVFVKMDFYTFKVAISDKNSEEIKVKLNDEFVEYKWLNTDELKNIKLAPPSITLFNRLGYLH